MWVQVSTGGHWVDTSSTRLQEDSHTNWLRSRQIDITSTLTGLNPWVPTCVGGWEGVKLRGHMKSVLMCKLIEGVTRLLRRAHVMSRGMIREIFPDQPLDHNTKIKNIFCLQAPCADNQRFRNKFEDVEFSATSCLVFSICFRNFKIASWGGLWDKNIRATACRVKALTTSDFKIFLKTQKFSPHRV